MILLCSPWRNLWTFRNIHIFGKKDQKKTVLSFNIHIFRPICLPEENLDLSNKESIAVGWGVTAVREYSQGTEKRGRKCQYKKGEYDEYALPDKLKKIKLK